METAVNTDYKKKFVPFALAAALVSLVGGFMAAVPAAIVAEWGINPAYNTWLPLAYAMGAAACAPILGKMSDVLGRRTTVLLGVAFYVIGQLITAVVSNITLVLIGRFIVGMGAAAIAPTVIGYITSNYPPAEMAKGFTLYMFLSSAMVIIGPTAGGLIMKAAGWRTVAFICAGLAAVVFVLAMLMVKKDEGPRKGFAGFDIFGGVFILIFFSVALSIPTFGQSYGWGNTLTLGAIAIAVVSLVFLVMAEKKAVNPILNGKFMARRAFILPIVILFLTQGLLQACMTNTIIFLRYAQPGNSILANFAISIMYIGMTLGTLFLGPLADKKEPRVVSAVALAFLLVGAGIQYFFTATAGFVVFAAALFLIGLGLGGNATIFMKVVLSGLSPAEAGAGSGTYTVFRDLSAPFGVALFVPMFTSAVSFGADKKPVVDTVVASMRSVSIAQVVCVAVGIGLCFLLPKIHEKKD